MLVVIWPVTGRCARRWARLDRGARQRPDVAVDGAEVEAERAQRDLDAGLLRARRRLTGPDEDTGQKRNSDEPPRTHGRLVFSALTWFPAGVHPTAAKVQERLAARGLTVEVQVLPDSTRTAAEAAAACSCEVGQIVKSLVFVFGGEATMVLCAGDRRVTAIDGRPASAEEARAATGFAIGGIPPLGHDRDLPTIVDESLRRFERVWCAAGTPHAVFETAPRRPARRPAGRDRRTRLGFLLDPEPHLRQAHELFERRVVGQVREPVLGRFGRFGGPLADQPADR